MEPTDILWIGFGGGLGSLLRWQVGRLVEQRFVTPFKLGTLFVNISGAFVIAYISAALAIGWEHRFGDVISSFVLTGILGGYTTFSTMQLDAVDMSGALHHVHALGYLVASIGGGLLAAGAGVALARM